MTTLAELIAMDDKEISAGYRAAGSGYNLAGGESPAFVHGWRNGQCDFNGHPVTEEMAALAREYVAWQRQQNSK